MIIMNGALDETLENNNTPKYIIIFLSKFLDKRLRVRINKITAK